MEESRLTVDRPPDDKQKQNEKLRVPVRLKNSARKFYLQSRDGIYYVRFDVPTRLREVDPLLPKTVFRSMDTNVLKAARLRAQDLIEKIFDGKSAEADEMRVQGHGWSTLDEVLEQYDPDPDLVKPETARSNRGSLRMIVREVTGREKVGDLPASVWARGDFLEKWIELRRRKLRSLNYVEQMSAKTTMRSTVAQARSVFAYPKLLTGLRLPDLTGFRAVKVPTVRRESGYQPLPGPSLAAMRADLPRLRSAAPEVYKVYLLMMCLGMRNSEVEAARWEWIVQGRHGGLVMRFELRPYWRSKNHKYGDVGIPADVARELQTLRGSAAPEDWIIAASSPTERFDICNREINAWVRKFIPPRNKGAYELRKHGASEILTRPHEQGGGIEAAAAFLRDTIATTEKYYAKYLREVRGVSLEGEAMALVA